MRGSIDHHRAVMGRSEKLLLAALFVILLVLLGVQSHSALLNEIKYGSIRIDLDSTIDFTVSPTLLNVSGDWIAVSVSGVQNPNNDDWIGVFASSSGDVPLNIESAPIKYKLANTTKSYVNQGQGSYKFSMVNPRGDFVIAFIRNGFQEPIMRAASEPIRFQNPDEPQFPHWSIGPEPSIFRLSWVSSHTDDAIVHWGPSPDQLDNIAYPEISHYTRDQMCGSPASTVGWFDPGYMCNALIADIPPSTTIYYRFGSLTSRFSELLQFRSPPADGQTVRFYAYGDMGSGSIDDSLNGFMTEQESLETSALMASKDFDPDFVLHIGDISYAKGYISQWDYFLWQISPIASKIPYQTAIGNHERDYPGSGGLFDGTDSGGECGVPYSYYFPTPEGASLAKQWYSFDTGSVHIVVMSGEDDFSPGSPQFEFLQQDLTSVDRNKTPWVIMTGHRPMYCDSTWTKGPSSDGVVAMALREALEDLLYETGVDLAIWGHNHSYQRTCPVFKEKCDKKAPIHIIVGTAGFSLWPNGNPVPPVWLQKRVDRFGIGRITATSSQLRFEFVLSDDGSVADSVVLNKINIESK